MSWGSQPHVPEAEADRWGPEAPQPPAPSPTRALGPDCAAAAPPVLGGRGSWVSSKAPRPHSTSYADGKHRTPVLTPCGHAGLGTGQASGTKELFVSLSVVRALQLHNQEPSLLRVKRHIRDPVKTPDSPENVQRPTEELGPCRSSVMGPRGLSHPSPRLLCSSQMPTTHRFFCLNDKEKAPGPSE